MVCNMVLKRLLLLHSRPQERPKAAALEGTGVIRCDYCPQRDEQKPFSYDLEPFSPYAPIYNMIVKFLPFADVSPKASRMVYQESQELMRLAAELRQKFEQQAVGFTRRSVAAMLAQAISTAQARLKVAKAVVSAAAAAAAQQPMCSGKSCFDLSKFMQGRQARAAPAGPTAYGVLVGNHMSMYGARAGVRSGQFKGYAPPRLAAQHSSGASGPCTAGPSSNGSGDSTSSSRAGGEGQKAAVVTVMLATEGQVRAGNKVVKARSSGGRRSSGSSSGGSNNSSSVPDFTHTPKAFRKLYRCAATRGDPHPADAAQTGTLREADLELLFSNSAAAGKRAGHESGMLSAPATPRGSSGGARNSRVSISSQHSGSVDLKVLLRNSSWGSSSLGGCSSLERSSSCGSLPEASLQLQQLPVVPVLPVIAGNISTAGVSGSWGMGRVCALVLVIVFLLVLVAYAMQQCLARVCSSVVSDGSGGTTTAVFF